MGNQTDFEAVWESLGIANDFLFGKVMQAADTKELPKRSRYYQSMIDLQVIDKGQPYKKLNRSYVIFICPFDLFGRGRHIYTFENICKEDHSILLGDEAVKIFLNADSGMSDVSPELKAFLDYVSGKKSEDIFIQRLEEAVKEAKRNRKWRHEYMTLAMRDQENLERGIEQGKMEMLFTLVGSKLLSLKDAASQADLTEDVFAEKMKNYRGI